MTSLILCSWANNMPAETCSGRVALMVYLGKSPIEHVPSISPAEALTGGYDMVIG